MTQASEHRSLDASPDRPECPAAATYRMHTQRIDVLEVCHEVRRAALTDYRNPHCDSDITGHDAESTMQKLTTTEHRTSSNDSTPEHLPQLCRQRFPHWKQRTDSRYLRPSVDVNNVATQFGASID